MRQLAAKEPARYINEFKIAPEALRSHLVPEKYLAIGGDSLEKLWNLDNYHDFVFERTAALTRAANEFFVSLR